MLRVFGRRRPARLSARRPNSLIESAAASALEALEPRRLLAGVTVGVVATDPSASESGPDRGAFRFSRSGDTTASMTLYYALSGTATNGTDYQKLGGSVTFAAGATTADVSVVPIADSASESTETVIATVYPSVKYTIGTKTATVNIANGGTTQPPPPPGGVTVSVAASDPNAAEAGADRGTFRFTRTGSTSTSLTVYYAIAGSATNGSDYQKLGGSVTFAAGAATADANVVPIDDSIGEGNETVAISVYPSNRYSIANKAATVTIADRGGTPSPANRPPRTPVFTEPQSDGELVAGSDLHMGTAPFSDPDPGQTHRASDFEIWTDGASPVRVWHAYGVSDFRKTHIHFGDGVFEGPLAGKRELPPDQNFVVRARYRDSSGDPATEYSAWGMRRFRTEPAQQPIPDAPDWTVDQAGYKVEKVPVTFGPGEGQFRLPVNIAFVPNPGPDPTDPLFYVTELYGSIRVVTRNYTVFTYASGLLNYNPAGSFPGEGENGLTGLAIDPATGDLFVSCLYEETPFDNVVNRAPKVVRLHSTDGGLHAATRTDILKMPGESQGQSHQISNVSIGPDGKLYVQNGDGFEFATAQNLDSFRGKVLRLNKDGSAPADNPFYDAADGITARDYVYAYGFRNPFGGAWRNSDGRLYEVENGSGLDRFARVGRGVNYGWDGNGSSLATNAIYNWSPAPAPVNLAFVQSSVFGGSGFPAAQFDRAFVTLSGPTYATGPQSRGKRIDEFVIDATGKVVGTPRTLVHYTGSGKATLAGIAAGPDGLYFSGLYKNGTTNGVYDPTAAGADLFRIRYVGG